ncbi:MAG: hypothetical protein JKY60_03670 [Kordiimonadaceae bacterium]|nr:hypothetical protein [Kordiimonadaceae bacterium]
MMKFFLKLLAGFCVWTALVYFVAAYPYASPIEVWNTRSSPHSGGIVYVFVVYGYGLVVLMALAVKLSRAIYRRFGTK